MKQEKAFIKTRIISLFLVVVLFCICGILACGSGLELSPDIDFNAKDYNTNSSSRNTNNTSNKDDNDFISPPIIDIDPPVNPPEPPKDNPPATDNTIKPSQYYSPDTYRNITWFNGSGKVSYKDKEYLSFAWTNMVKNFYIIDQRYNGAGSKEKLNFKENGDIYWEKKPDTILKKFQGGTIIMYRGGSLWTGDYNTTYGVGGVYTTATSRDEATKLGSEAVKKWATFQGYTKYSFGRYDNGGKVGIVEILVLNYGYSWNSFTWYGFDCYARKNEFSTERYFGSNIKSPEENMRYLDVDWKLWDEGIDLWFMKY